MFTKIMKNMNFNNTFKCLFWKPIFKFSTLSISQNLDYNNNCNQFIIRANDLRDNKGARLPKERLGRGRGSGKGKTSGRGHKGYTARTGEPHRHFEGGQTPMSRKYPKHGFRRKTAVDNYTYINLSKVIYLIIKNRIDPNKPITLKELFWSGGVSKIKYGVKLLARGSEDLSSYPPLHFEVSNASIVAINQIKKYGGTITVKHRTKLTMRAYLKPWKYFRQPLDPIAKFRIVQKMMKYEKRGLLVKYVRPRWQKTVNLEKRELLRLKKLDEMPNASLLPQYPIIIKPHMNDGKIRQRRPRPWRRLHLEMKNY